MDIEEIKKTAERVFVYNFLDELLACFRKFSHIINKLSYKDAKELLISSVGLYQAFVKLDEYNVDATTQNLICDLYFNDRNFSILLGTFLDISGKDIESFLGNKAKTSKKILSIDEVNGLIERAHSGDTEARDILVEKNKGLVKSLASYYFRMSKKMDFDDLCQEGTIGLLRAIDDFDAQKGFRFSTYAVYWIRATMVRAMEDFDRTIKVSIHTQERIKKMNYVREDLIKLLNREPTIEEIAERMELSVKTVMELIHFSEDAVSLEAKIGDDDTELLEFVSDDVSVEDEVIQKEYSDLLWGVIKSVLDDREYDIISKRMGHLNGKIYSLEEIASLYGITRERVRQIEDKVLTKLQKPNVRKLIEETESTFKTKERRDALKSSVTDIDAVDRLTISNLFSGYNIEVIRNLAESCLSEHERIILYLKYGNDLMTVKNISLKDRTALFSVIIPKLYNALKSTNKYGISNRLMQLFPDYNPLEIRLAIFELKNIYKEYMLSMFGINLMEEIVLNREQIRFFKTNIFPAIMSNLEKNKSMKVLLSDIFPGVDIELLRKIIDHLPITNQEIIYGRYGRYLNELNVIKPEYRKRLYGSIIPQIEAMINDKYLFLEGYSILSHFEGYNISSIGEAINVLSSSDQRVMRRRFGKNLDEVKMISAGDYERLYDYLIPYISKILSKEIIVAPAVKPHKAFFDFFPSYNREELLKSVENLPKFYKELIYKRYGESLNEFNRVSDREASIITSAVFRRIEALLQNVTITHTEKTLIEHFSDYSTEELTGAIEVLFPSEKELLIKKYGENLDDVLVMLSKEEDNMIPKILEKISRYLNGKLVNGKKNDSFYAMIGLPKAKVLERIEYLTEEEIKDIYEYCGYDLDHVVRTYLPLEREKYIELHVIMKIKKEFPSIVDAHKAKEMARKIIEEKLLSFEITENELVYLILRHAIGFSKPFAVKNILAYIGISISDAAEVEKKYTAHNDEFDKLTNICTKKEYILVKSNNN